MTDDKKPREWIVPAEWQVSGKKFDAAATVRVVEGSAYDSLAERLKVAEAERLHFWKICVERAEQVDTLNTELLNTKELSSKLVEENAALRAEVERLHQAWGKPNTDIINELHREREITAMLREALEAIAKSIPESINTSEVEVEQTAAAQRALAREKDLRSDKSGKA